MGGSGPWKERQILFQKGMLGWPRALDRERWWKWGGGGVGDEDREGESVPGILLEKKCPQELLSPPAHFTVETEPGI